ncbi:MAG: ATP-binding protein [Candidatus Sumerlaeota bacterium]|nr:ATP-binding protein [Candidatus Sumerlaeota bacterium]
MRSIRRELTLGLFVGLALLLGTSGAMLFGMLRRALINEFDAALLEKARALASHVERKPNNRVEFEHSLPLLADFAPGPQAEYFVIWCPNGQRVERSESLTQEDFEKRLKHQAVESSPSPGTGHCWNLTLPNGERGRATALSLFPEPDSDEFKEQGQTPPSSPPVVYLAVTRSRRSLDHTLDAIRWTIGGVGAALPFAVALLIWVLVKRGLRPLNRLAAESKQIDSSNLQRRFDESRTPREIRPIVRRLNDLLKRLEAAFQRERRFTADAAHELRTPIAELRSLAEVALMCPDDAALSVHALQEALAIAEQMDRLVSALLALARSEGGALAPAFEPVSLAEAARQAWQPIEARAAQRRLAVEWRTENAGQATTDRAMLGAVLKNLLLNAVEHSPEGGRIAVSALSRDGAAGLSIANTNSSLTEDDLPHLFEPFWRKEASRTDPTHSGLGLTVAAAFCRLMQADLSARLKDGQFIIELAFAEKSALK